MNPIIDFPLPPLGRTIKVEIHPFSGNVYYAENDPIWWMRGATTFQIWGKIIGLTDAESLSLTIDGTDSFRIDLYFESMEKYNELVSKAIAKINEIELPEIIKI